MLLARNESNDRLQVFDEQGTPMGQVNLPSDPRLFGAEKGTVYLERPIPTSALLGSPAQAA